MLDYIKLDLKRCKNFGYTFSIFFLILALYNFYIYERLSIFLYMFLFILFVTVIYPSFFRIPNYFWMKFGILLGKIISPIILSLIYLVTILPIKLILTIFKKDILNKNIYVNQKSYWINSKHKKINFYDQF